MYFEDEFFFKITFLLIVFCTINCDIEHLVEDSDTNDLKEELENKVCLNETFWDYFHQNLDLNRDSLIDSKELKQFIHKQIKKLHDDDFIQQINRLDQIKSGKISFESYLLDSFERTFNEMEKIESENSEEFFDLINLYRIEKSKWNYISANVEFLDYSNFYKFVYSEEFKIYNDYESKIRFETADINHDNVIDVDEFKANTKTFDDSLIDSKTQQFSKGIDLNNDNYINRHEYQKWYNPDIDQQVNEQKQYIFTLCDNDHDDYLNKTEILNNCKILLGSQVTNFGLDFMEKKDTSRATELKTEL